MHQDFKICLVNAFRMGMNMKISKWRIAHHVNHLHHRLLIKKCLNNWSPVSEGTLPQSSNFPAEHTHVVRMCSCADVRLCSYVVVQMCSCAVVQLCSCGVVHTHVVRIARQRALRWDVWQEMSDFSSLVQDRFLTAPIFGPSDQIFCTFALHKV